MSKGLIKIMFCAALMLTPFLSMAQTSPLGFRELISSIENTFAEKPEDKSFKLRVDREGGRRPQLEAEKAFTAEELQRKLSEAAMVNPEAPFDTSQRLNMSIGTSCEISVVDASGGARRVASGNQKGDDGDDAQLGTPDKEKTRVCTVCGNFTDTSSEQTLILKIHEMALGGEIEIFSQQMTKLEHLQGYSFLGVCRSFLTGLHQLIFKGWFGSAAIPSGLVFVYYNRDQKLFVRHELRGVGEALDRYLPCYLIPAKASGKLSGKCLCRWEQVEEDRIAAECMYRQLAPSEECDDLPMPDVRTIHKKPLKTKQLTDIQLIELLGKIARLRDDGYDITIHAENEHWVILAVSYDQLMILRWGVLLAKKKGVEGWIAFYNIPPHQSGKPPCFHPEMMFMGKGRIASRLCPDCSYWNDKHIFVFDLEEMTISTGDKEHQELFGR